MRRTRKLSWRKMAQSALHLPQSRARWILGGSTKERFEDAPVPELKPLRVAPASSMQ
jgi:hypothetical protein